MRIAMIGPFGLRRKGTMRARALPLARVLVRRGHQVTLLIPPWDSPDDAGRRWTVDGVEIVNVDLPSPRPGLHHAAIAGRLVVRTLALKPDVVHAFKPKAYAGLTATGLWALRRLGLAGSRLVVDTDDWEGAGGWNEIEPYSPAQRLFFAWQERWGLTHCDAVTVASRALETLAWSLGVRPERLHYVPNGVPQSEVSRPTTATARDRAPTKRILLYTRFVEFEVERLIAVWRQVAERVPDARLVVAGQGLRGEERLLMRQADALDIPGRIEYLGWPGRAAMPGIFAACDLAIVPFDDTLVNRTKCSAKLVELMAAGLPVVADAVGQNRGYIEPGISGLLVPPGDVEGFAQAVVGLLEDADRGRRLGAAARQRIAGHFTWEHLVAEVERAYGVVVAGR